MAQSAPTVPLFNNDLLSLRKTRARKTLSQAPYLIDDMKAYIVKTLGFTITTPETIQAILILGPQTNLPHIFSHQFHRAKIKTIDPLVDLDYVRHLSQKKFDIIVDMMTIHWSNDPLQYLMSAKSLLKPGGFYIAGFLGGSTLTELRQTLIETDIQLFDGAFARVSPMIKPEAATRLIQSAGYQDPIVDHEEVVVQYKGLKDLVKDLRYMGESNALTDQTSHLPSDDYPCRRFSKSYIATAEACYHRLFQSKTIDMTFDFVFMSGWAPQ